MGFLVRTSKSRARESPFRVRLIPLRFLSVGELRREPRYRDTSHTCERIFQLSSRGHLFTTGVYPAGNFRWNSRSPEGPSAPILILDETSSEFNGDIFFFRTLTSTNVNMSRPRREMFSPESNLRVSCRVT